MRRFVTQELQSYLKAVDGLLKAPFHLIAIGGAAASLGFRSDRGTHDIDTINDVSPIRDALDEAAAKTGLRIPVCSVGIWDGPYEFEDRLRRVAIKGLKRLSVLVPEVHDWVLMKSMRADERDLEAIEDVSKRVHLDLDLLCDRFVKEMTHVMGPRRQVEDNFLAVVERLFGEEAADRMEPRVRRE
jgi:hypothetical protein